MALPKLGHRQDREPYASHRGCNSMAMHLTRGFEPLTVDLTACEKLMASTNVRYPIEETTVALSGSQTTLSY